MNGFDAIFVVVVVAAVDRSVVVAVIEYSRIGPAPTMTEVVAALAVVGVPRRCCDRYVVVAAAEDSMVALVESSHYS